MKILLTGFNSFGKVRENPSEQVVKRLAAKALRNGRIRLVAEVLPTEYGAATRKIRRLIRSERPDAILCLGVASSRKRLSLERVALNLDDDAERDNARVARHGLKIAGSGPPAYWSTLPLDAFQRALKRCGIAVNFSNHAGTFLCNHVFYAARHEVAGLRRGIPCGFLHLPSRGRPGKGGKRGMSLDRMVKAVECCLKVLGSTVPKKKSR